MPAYFVAEIEVTNPEGYEPYRARAGASIAQYGGRFLVRGGKAELLEGAGAPKRLVIVEFPSFEQAKKWHASPEYAPLIKLRQKASKGRLGLVEGA